MQGIIYKSTGSWYQVKDETGKMFRARIKGKMKIDKQISSSNPVAVGDWVLMDAEDGGPDQTIIHTVKDRKNYIVRVSPHNKHQKHIVAANLDSVLLIVTIAQPQTSLGFIDRFLVTAEAYQVPAILVVNKVDLLSEEDFDTLERWAEIYERIGHKVLAISAHKPESLQVLKDELQGKITLFSG
ncbi:MAG: GTPase RsgA, partial [Chitinophagaceae bacterium]|nr:GTPase RsgA [Chitinophagaceae bacterium]